MQKQDAEKVLFKSENDKASGEEFVRIHVPMINDPSYDVTFLSSNKLVDLENGVTVARKVGDFCWYAIACSIAKIIDGGMYLQAGLTQTEYKEKTQERLGIDFRRFSEYLQAGRFLIDHGQRLVNMGWRPEGMQNKIMLANSAKKVIKNESKLLDHIMNDSLDSFKAMIRKQKAKVSLKGPKQTSILDGRQLMLNGKVIATIDAAVEGDDLADLEMLLNTFAQSRQKGGRIAAFVVETDRQAKNAPRVFTDYVDGKLQRKRQQT